MKQYGQHLLAEYHGCDAACLGDAMRIERAMRRAAEAAKATVVSATFHRFAPGGVTGVLVLEESHMTIHTWPEYGYAAVDVFTCGSCTPDAAHGVLFTDLGAQRAEVMTVQRGATPPAPGLQVAGHRWEWPSASSRAPSGPARPVLPPERTSSVPS